MDGQTSFTALCISPRIFKNNGYMHTVIMIKALVHIELYKFIFVEILMTQSTCINQVCGFNLNVLVFKNLFFRLVNRSRNFINGTFSNAYYINCNPRRFTRVTVRCTRNVHKGNQNVFPFSFSF